MECAAGAHFFWRSGRLKGYFAAQKLCGFVRYARRVAGSQLHGFRSGSNKRWVAIKVISKAFGNQRGLTEYADAGAQGGLEFSLHQRVVSAAKDRGVGVRHFAQKRVNVAAHQCFGQYLVAFFDGIDDAATGLGFDIHANCAKRQFALKGAAGHGCRGRKQRHLFDADLAGHGFSSGVGEDLQSRNDRDWRITFPDASNYDFSALVTSFQVNAPLDGVISATIVLTPSGDFDAIV